MQSKSLIYFGLFIGSTAGSYIPTLWGASFLSFSSVLFSALGGIAGIYIFYKISQ